MPMVSSEIAKTHPARGGLRVIEEHTDSLGRKYVWKYWAPDLAAANAIRTGRAALAAQQAKDRDFQDILRWVQAGNTPQTFDFTDRDFTLLEAADALIKWFARNEGGQALTIAHVFEGVTLAQWNTIADRLGYSQAKRDRIRTRGQAILAAASTFDTVEDDDG